MASKLFHLLGEDASTARSIEFAPSIDEEGLRNLVASHFAIVEAKGVAFHGPDSALETVADVVAAEDPIAVSIDGKAVREIPGPKGLPWIGNYLEVYPDHLGNHQRLFDMYGPIFKTTNLGRTVYQTNDPQLAAIFFTESEYFSKKIGPGHPLIGVKNNEAGIFVADTDTKSWRMAHKFFPPFLGPRAVRNYVPTMQKTVEDSFKVFDELDERDEAWNVYPYMLKMASQTIGKLLLGMDFQHFEKVDSPLDSMISLMAEGVELNKKISAWGDWYARLPFGDPRRLRDNSNEVIAKIEESAKKASTGGIEDLELQDAAIKAHNMVDYILRATDIKGNKFPKEKYVLPLTVITAAGFTTTSSLLSWLVHALVTYPGNQERLLQELIDNDFDENTQMTTDLINKLTFLDKFIKETLRRHNPAFQPGRTALLDLILPGGYKMPKDSVVITGLHHIHNNSAIWDSPARFDPDRWDTDKVKNRPHASFMPFGTGQRMCIGFNFALNEVKVFFPKLVYRYRFALAADGAVEYDPMFLLIRPTNLYVRAERRVKWPGKTTL